MVRQERQRMADGDEPLFSDKRQVVQRRQSCYVNVTKNGERLLDLDSDSEVTVHVYRDRIVIERRDEE